LFREINLTYYKYYNGNTNKDGTAEYEIVTKKVDDGNISNSKSKGSITPADLTQHRERKSFF